MILANSPDPRTEQNFSIFFGQTTANKLFRTKSLGVTCYQNRSTYVFDN